MVLGVLDVANTMSQLETNFDMPRIPHCTITRFLKNVPLLIGGGKWLNWPMGSTWEVKPWAS